MSCHHAKPGTSGPAGAHALPPDTGAVRLLGLWEYVSARTHHPDSTPHAGAGLLITVAIDSVRGNELMGHVARWFAGDMGARPGAFGPVRGVAAGTDIRLTIPFARGHAEPIAVRATRTAPDTLAIVTATGALAEGGLLVRTNP